jgi:hypothetical protein
LADRIIISGDPGTRWTNDTPRVLYQFIAALINTCGVCLQYHLKISTAWPIPIHYGCRCIQRAIEPGGKAQHDFVDYRKLLDRMSDDEKTAAIGKSNYRLLKSGLATWDDIVTPSRVRDFREVVAKKHLTVDQMVKHGIKPYQAEKAYNAVHTAEHEAAAAHRKQLLNNLVGAGLSQQQVVNELAGRLAARVTIGEGPTGPYTTGPAWGGGPLPGTGGSSAAELAALISGWKPRRQTAAMGAKPAEPAAPKPSAASVLSKHERFEEVSKQIFGRVITDQEVANLGGLPDGQVTVYVNDDGHIKITSVGSQVESLRTIKSSGGKLILVADELRVKDAAQGKGLGADIFARMVDQATGLKFDRIAANAIRSQQSNGYYTWPRFGYDGDLAEMYTADRVPVHQALPDSLKGASRVSDLMMTDEGKQWWKQHGGTNSMRFDLKPGSRSREVWDLYRREKAGSNPTSPPPT